MERFASISGMTIRALSSTASAQISSPDEVAGVHVAPTTNSDTGEYIGNSIYWDYEEGKVVDVKRDGTTIGQATTNRYLDLTAVQDTKYTYTIESKEGSFAEGIQGGTPQITNTKVEPVSITTQSANVKVSWLTEGIPSSSTVHYGTTPGSYTGEVTRDKYDEEHVMLINSLDPEQTYYFTVTSKSITGESSTSKEFSYTVPASEKAKSIFTVIFEALKQVFGNVFTWLHTPW